MSTKIHIPDEEKVDIPEDEEAVEATWEELTDGRGDDEHE